MKSVGASILLLSFLRPPSPILLTTCPQFIFFPSLTLLPQKRASLGDGPVDGEHIAPMPKKPRIAANRGAHLAHDAIQLSHFALTNLAALVISSCTTCHGQWLHISEQTLAPDHCEFTFQCAQGHSAKWTSNTTSHDTTAHIKDPNYVEDGENAEEDQVEN